MGGDGAGEESKGAEEVNINVRCSNGSKFSVQVSLNSAVGSFKDLVARNCDIPVEQQRLIYKGRILKDDQTLQSYGNFYFPHLAVVNFVCPVRMNDLILFVWFSFMVELNWILYGLNDIVCS